jgi:hypothetical protein
MLTGTFLHKQLNRFCGCSTRTGNPSSKPLKIGGNTRKSTEENLIYHDISRRLESASLFSQTSSAASKKDSYFFLKKPSWTPSRLAFRKGFTKSGYYHVEIIRF